MEDSFMQNPQLEGRTCFLQGSNNNCVILIHGFTATTVEVRPFASFLNERGYSVYCPLLPGHGTTPNDLNHQSWINWVEIVDDFYRDNESKYEKIFVGGESMGGVIACFLAAKNPKIKGILLFAPAIKVDNLEFSKFVRFIKHQLPKKNIKVETEEGKLPWQGYNVHPTKAAYQFFLLQNETKTLLSQIYQSVIIFQGAMDQTISPESSKIIYNHIKSTKKEYVYLENSGHCILLDKEINFVYRKAFDFISEL